MMRQRSSTYSKMYLVSPGIYEKLLNCLDDTEKMQAQEHNRPNEELPKRPSEQIIEDLHMEEIGQPISMPQLPPPPQPIYPDLSEELHRERMGGTLYPSVPRDVERLPRDVRDVEVSQALYPSIPGEVEMSQPQPMLDNPTDPWSELEREIELTGDLPPMLEPPPVRSALEPPVVRRSLEQPPVRPALEPPVVRRPKKSVRFGIPIATFREQVALKQRERLQKVKPLKKYRYGPIIEPLQHPTPIPPTSVIPARPLLAQARLVAPPVRPPLSQPPMPVQNITTQEAYRRELSNQACGKNKLCATIKNQRMPKNVCPICGRTFGRNWNLTRHMSDVHSRLPDEDFPIEEDTPRTITYTEQYPTWHPPLSLKSPYKRGVKNAKLKDPWNSDKVQKLDRDFVRREQFDRWMEEPD